MPKAGDYARGLSCLSIAIPPQYCHQVPSRSGIHRLERSSGVPSLFQDKMHGGVNRLHQRTMP
jgi:hypothetical protein